MQLASPTVHRVPVASIPANQQDEQRRWHNWYARCRQLMKLESWKRAEKRQIRAELRQLAKEERQRQQKAVQVRRTGHSSIPLYVWQPCFLTTIVIFVFGHNG